MLIDERHISGIVDIDVVVDRQWCREWEKDVNYNWRSFILRHIIFFLLQDVDMSNRPSSSMSMCLSFEEQDKNRRNNRRWFFSLWTSKKKEIDWIQHIWFDSVLISLFLSHLCVYIYIKSRFSLFSSTTENRLSG